ncbi:tail protein X [Pseudomonas nitroreducens]|uniref:tail protein X n=1 Tax=Pseudomonas nitroreducens TaxID=46680 RepID=UPI001FB69A9A|nr:tail protein X [Pseudomonas nitroreducens]MCJ1878573.1 tail protein X [Pseudomonas nitroreducens]MCJ1896613.1 tail protein X [Pseudomonas nitroreducens]
MATTIVRSVDGDLLDHLCYQRYGHLNGCVEAVLDANPGLADEAQPLRGGVIIRLPELLVPADQSVRFWE